MNNETIYNEYKPTREDVEALKKDWIHDATWDIEDTEFYDDYRDELLAFRKEMEKQWKQERQQHLKNQRQMWFELNLNDSFSPEKHITITRVPGGWVMENGLRESLAMTFIPYSNEFLGE